MSAIVIATKNGKCLPVLAASISMYLPDFFTVYISGSGMILPKHRTITSDNTADNFGDAYNNVVHQAMDDGHKTSLSVTMTLFSLPTPGPLWLKTYRESPQKTVVGLLHGLTMREDVRTSGSGTRAIETVYAMLLRTAIIEVDVIAPICAWIESKNWVDFPPLNWYSDDIQCIDMQEKGLKHYISRAYVHHVGSQTTGHKPMELTQASIPWIRENRPELAELWFKSS
jgi:hypothetical protein